MREGSTEGTSEKGDRKSKVSDTKGIPQWDCVTNSPCARINEIICCERVAHSVLFYVLFFLFLVIFVYILRKLVSLPGGHSKLNGRKLNNNTGPTVRNYSSHDLTRKNPVKWPKIYNNVNPLDGDVWTTIPPALVNSPKSTIYGASGDSEHGITSGRTTPSNLEYDVGNNLQGSGVSSPTDPVQHNGDFLRKTLPPKMEHKEYDAWVKPNIGDASGNFGRSWMSDHLANHPTFSPTTRYTENSGFKNTYDLSNWNSPEDKTNGGSTAEYSNSAFTESRLPTSGLVSYSGSNLPKQSDSRFAKNSVPELQNQFTTTSPSNWIDSKNSFSGLPWSSLNSGRPTGSGFGWVRSDDQDRKSAYPSYTSSTGNQFYFDEASGKWAYSGNNAYQTIPSEHYNYVEPEQTKYDSPFDRNTWNTKYNNYGLMTQNEDWDNDIPLTKHGNKFLMKDDNKNENGIYQGFGEYNMKDNEDETIHRWPSDVHLKGHESSRQPPRNLYANDPLKSNVDKARHQVRPGEKVKGARRMKSNILLVSKSIKLTRHTKTKVANFAKKTEIPHHRREYKKRDRIIHRSKKLKLQQNSKVNLNGKKSRQSKKLKQNLHKRRLVKSYFGKHQSKRLHRQFSSYAFIKRHGKWKRRIHHVKGCKTLSKFKVDGKVRLKTRYLHQKQKYKYTIISCKSVVKRTNVNTYYNIHKHRRHKNVQLCREFWFITTGKIILRKINIDRRKNNYLLSLCKRGIATTVKEPTMGKVDDDKAPGVVKNNLPRRKMKTQNDDLDFDSDNDEDIMIQTNSKEEKENDHNQHASQDDVDEDDGKLDLDDNDSEDHVGKKFYTSRQETGIGYKHGRKNHNSDNNSVPGNDGENDLDDYEGDFDNDSDDDDNIGHQFAHQKLHLKVTKRKAKKHKTKTRTSAGKKLQTSVRHFRTHAIKQKMKKLSPTAIHQTMLFNKNADSDDKIYQQLLGALTKKHRTKGQDGALISFITAHAHKTSTAHTLHKKRQWKHSRGIPRKRTNFRKKKNNSKEKENQIPSANAKNDARNFLENILSKSSNIQRFLQGTRTGIYNKKKRIKKAHKHVAKKVSQPADIEGMMKAFLSSVSGGGIITTTPRPVLQPTTENTPTSDQNIQIMGLLSKLGVKINGTSNLSNVAHNHPRKTKPNNSVSNEISPLLKGTTGLEVPLNRPSQDQRQPQIANGLSSKLSTNQPTLGEAGVEYNSLRSTIPTAKPIQITAVPALAIPPRPTTTPVTSVMQRTAMLATRQSQHPSNGYSNYISSDFNSEPYQLPLINILCFGDSLTSGFYNHGRGKHPYSIRLRQVLNNDADHRYNVVTRGVVGEMAHGSMTKRLPKVLNEGTRFDWVIILGGTNDVAHVKNFGDDEDFTEQLISIWSPKLVKDIESLHQTARKYGARTVVMTIPETAYELWPEFRSIRSMRLSVNAALRQYAMQVKDTTVLCDLAIKLPRSSLSQKLQKVYWNDHIHLNPVGYNKMAEIIAQCIQPYLTK